MTVRKSKQYHLLTLAARTWEWVGLSAAELMGEAMMFKKWLGVVVLVGWLGQGTGVLGQYLPSPVGAARMPAEPLPLGATPRKPIPNLVPGPISPLAAPRGPADDLSLPGNHTSAFQCDECLVPHHVYFHAGAIGLRRQRLGHGITAFVDPTDPSGLDTGNLTLLGNVSPVQDLDRIDPKMSYGIKGTLGYLIDNYAVELSGFYIPQQSDSIQNINPGRLNSFFFNSPLGFEGNNGIDRQADLIRATNQTSLGSVELNIRYFSQAVTGIEPIFGIRYLDLQERFGLFVDDDGLSFLDIFGRGDPTRAAEYATRTINRIIAPQFGAEYQANLFKGVALGLMGKAAVGVNYSDIDVVLRRGDGFTGFAGSRQRINLSQIYETGAFLDVYLLDRLRVRAGYMAMLLVNVPEPVDQLSFDLSQINGRQDNTGTIFFHGPSFEFQFLF